jgi:hypothetical protein
LNVVQGERRAHLNYGRAYRMLFKGSVVRTLIMDVPIECCSRGASYTLKLWTCLLNVVQGERRAHFNYGRAY